MKRIITGSVISVALCLAVTLTVAPSIFAKDGDTTSISNQVSDL